MPDINKFTDGDIANEDGQYTWQGNGIFDILMKAVNGNIKVEFDNGRINTSDYANVYLGALQTVIQQSMQFILTQPTVENDILIKRAQSDKDLEVKDKQIESMGIEDSLKQSQILLTDQQRINLTAEALNIPKQGVILDNQASQIAQQTNNLTAELLNIPKQGELIDAQKESVSKQTELYQRQKEGFDDNKYHKLVEAQLNTWALVFSSGMIEAGPEGEGIPTIIRSDAVTALYNKLVPNDPV